MKKMKTLLQEVVRECGNTYDTKPMVEKINDLTAFHTNLMSKLFDVDSSSGIEF